MLLDKRLDEVILSNASTRGEDHRQTVPRLLKPTQGLYGGNRGESPLMAAFKNMKVARQSLGATSTALRPVLSEEKSMVPSQGSPRQRSDHKQGRRFVSDELHQPVQILNASQNVPCMLFRRGARMRMQELAPEHRTDAQSSIGDVMTCILMPRVPETREWAATVGPNVRSPTAPQERAEIDVANRHPRAELVVQSIDAQGQLNTISSSIVQSARSWAWWAFKKGGDVTWILTTTGIVVIFPLYFQIARDMAIAEAETQQIQQLRAQGYNQAQINQMMGGAPAQQ
ncbi:Hypothetical Protein FCC1311_033212 [Hondaea fermentalgiana]|uniref:Uncharacterized protein n=1 Tax=Hondaea fermentalgiana TaxID=2315210 RepID=A0A2R5GBL1_9STRA|nr:Hypothetical Protein FCC1311_033212 [Hondaea fermentalgiana]|eukprot:GBG27098.1 Hypothetical Protein FCC1311_033212 [Hondaea fermentalgiana]